jgi:hypothetical protein
VTTLERVKPTLPPVTFPTLGWQVVDWIEAFCCYGPGDVQGEDAKVSDELALFLCWAYRLWPQDHPRAGKRMVHWGILSRPKGWQKSEAAAWIDLCEALGPARFDGWDARGEPVGAPINYPFIRCLATEETQAEDTTYGAVAFIAAHGRVGSEYALDIGRDWDTSTRLLIKEPGGGEIRPCSSGAASKDGGKESHSTEDEPHLYVTPELRKMHATVARNTGKRTTADPWLLSTTTMFEVGENSVFERAWDGYAHIPIEECVTRHGVLLDHRQGPEPARFGDDRSLAKSMRVAYGDAAAWADIEKKVRIVRTLENPEADAYRYNLNRRREAASAWLSPEEIAAFLANLDVEPGSMVCGGFDGSESDDHTAIMGCTEAGDLFTVGVWVPKPGDLGWREEVSEAVAWFNSTFKVLRFYADPAWWIDELGNWHAQHGNVREFWTGGHSEAKMAVATGACRSALRHGAKVDVRPLRTTPLRVIDSRVRDDASEFDGKPLVRWHFENARMRKVRVRQSDADRAEGREPAQDAFILRKERKGSPLKIDCAVASVLARRARDDALKDGEFIAPVEPDYTYASW